MFYYLQSESNWLMISVAQPTSSGLKPEYQVLILQLKKKQPKDLYQSSA